MLKKRCIYKDITILVGILSETQKTNPEPVLLKQINMLLYFTKRVALIVTGTVIQKSKKWPNRIACNFLKYFYLVFYHISDEDTRSGIQS